MKARNISAAALLLISIFPLADVRSQTAVFLYQGRLNDGGNAANGSYDMQFKLFDALAGGNQIGSTQSNAAVAVSAGTFAVSLDFGANAFPGAGRYLEVAVRPAGNPNPHTVLAPRTQILTSPYSIRSNSAAVADTATNATTATNALNLGGVAANQFVQTNDPRLSDARTPLPGSANYIHNGIAQQTSANFNISGNGTVGTLNANGAVTIGGVAAPAGAPAGEGRIFFDSTTNKFRISESGGAYVNLVGSNGVSGAGTTGALPLWSAGTTLGNSVVTQTGNNVGVGSAVPLHRLGLGGGPAWTTHSWSGLIDLENASAIGWRANGGGTRFGMGHTNDGFFIFRTASELGTSSNPPIYDLKMDNAGNMGIGGVATNTDLSSARLNILNLSLGYGFLNTLGSVSVGSYVDATAGGYGTRSNHPLHFFTNNLAPQATLATNGNFGIGTTSPNAKLHVAGGGTPAITATSQGNAVIGTSSGPGFASVFGENTSLSGGFGVYGKGTNGYAVFAEGHAGQSRDKGGFVKAMAYVSEAGTIVRCFNSANVSPLIANCGFTLTHTTTGRYVINFGFAVNDRFVVTEGHGFVASHNYGAGLGNANAIEVFIVDFTNTLRESAFTIVVF